MGRRSKRSKHRARGDFPAAGRQRQQAAELAARFMVDGGIRDFSIAKAKAAERLGMVDGLPSNAEIEQALIEYQRLFRFEAHADELQVLRSTALEAMRFFERFHPRLTGGVLTGSAGRNAVIELHVFSDVTEAVGIFLDEQRMPYEMDEKRFRDGRGGYQFFPLYRFVADDTPVEVVVFPETGIRQSPPSLVDGKPIERADQDRVQDLLTTTV